MILSDTEFESITCGTHASPHDLLGMHRLADGGVVVRAFLPLAKGVVAVPTDQVNKPVIPLRRVGDSDLFEGVAEEEAEQAEEEAVVEESNEEVTETTEEELAEADEQVGDE
mgnify:CR=1 FL=1